ncbi:Ethanolamine ammonia-lyase light chain [Methylobrevis pamukkalensis]|uniref:Ethanolamine ammonia-lyase light chain n=1 Tax=Methylobrevis pamukkalensis TaxID=1439726 RepID=A0A1E3H7V3_9HYPH|nr:Ethanolamine ammonia-lyase light chain [Methylobrevis pamukkalensis]
MTDLDATPALDETPILDATTDLDAVWRRLASLTPARIGLGRSGAGLPTAEVLRFSLAHAQARDAVLTPFDAKAFVAELTALGLPSVEVSSAAPVRDVYLRRPDLGRRLDETGAARLDARPEKGADLAVVVADGLSSTAIAANAAAFLAELLPRLGRLGLSLAPVVVASGGRVALGDEVGERLAAKMVLVLIGERPGLSSPDSLGAISPMARRSGAAMRSATASPTSATAASRPPPPPSSSPG